MFLFQRKFRVLLVCRENLCRSPMAEGLLSQHLRLAGLARRVHLQSVGTQATQPGSRPDQRAERAAGMVGIDLTRMRSARVTLRDMQRSNLVYAMDLTNVEDLLEICPTPDQHKISLLLSQVPGHPLEEVPDPYYGSTEGFETVFALLEAAMPHLVDHIAEQLA